ncbi:MAG: hypothetical protein WBX25_15775 [Rhodomicrobium sp.]
MAQAVVDQLAQPCPAGVNRLYRVYGYDLSGLNSSLSRQAKIDWLPLWIGDVAGPRRRCRVSSVSAAYSANISRRLALGASVNTQDG